MLAKFSFDCQQCGSYRVSQKTFMKFVPEAFKAEVQHRVINGSEYGVIRFDNGCPKCTPSGKSSGEVVVLKYKIN